MSFTQGPWRVIEPDGWPFKVVVASGDVDIVTLSGPHSTKQKTVEDWRSGVGFNGEGQWSREAAIAGVAQAEANARLIAAAPELLEALKYLLELGGDDDRRIAAESAIVKAEGK